MTLVDTDGKVLETPVRVLVAVPCGEMVHADFAYDLARMVGYTTLVKPAVVILLYHLKGTYLPRARATLMNEALEQDCTHILWLDADMRFPKDTLLHLLGRAKPIVAANYPTRQAPILPTAIGFNKQPMFEGEGLEPCWTCGMGVMLVERPVLKAMDKPYFAIGYNRSVDDYAGEDTFFCEQAKRKGYDILIDWTLSEQVAHCGGLPFGMAHARATFHEAAKQVLTPENGRSLGWP